MTSAEKRPRALWTRVPVLLVVLGIGVLFFGLVTKGTFNPFHRLGLRAVFFEDQARSLLHGHLWVTSESIDGEAIISNGHPYGYFGIVPALLRVPVMALFPNAPAGVWWPYWWPYLATWYFTAAFALEALCAIGLARWCTRQVRRIRGWSAPLWDALGEAGLVAAILGSSTLFLTARVYPYEEAILWGVAFALATVWSLLLLHETGRIRYAVLAGIGAIGTIGSRPTVGAGAVVAMLCFIPVVWRRRAAVYTVAVGAATALASYCLVTELKFGTLLSPPWQNHIQYANSPQRLALVKAGASSVRYIPTTMLQYLRPDTLCISCWRFHGWPHGCPFSTRCSTLATSGSTESRRLQA